MRSCGFVQVSDQHDSAPGSLCNVSQTAEDGTDFICPVHVHICAQKRLYRVNDNQPCVVFPDCPCYAFIGKLKDSPTTRVLIHEKSSLAPPGQSLAFSLGDEKGFEWIGAYDITADELLAGTDTAKTESKTAQAQMLILELLADGKRMPSAELEKTVNERGISSRTMRTAKSRIGDRLVTEKDGTAWVCYLRD